MCFHVSAYFGNLSWQYVNSINWIVCVEEGDMGVCIWLGAPIMHKMSGLSLAWHLHGIYSHEHLMNQSGIVCYDVNCAKNITPTTNFQNTNLNV
jgi:hypothetical protein